MKELPDVPSALLTLALDDLEKAEVDPRYVIDMNHWHQPALRGSRDMLCAVCLAGSVIAFSLGVPPYHPSRPGNFDADTCRKLIALDEFRAGSYSAALQMLHVRDAEYLLSARLRAEFWPTDAYHNAPAAFKARLRALAERLEGMGL